MSLRETVLLTVRDWCEEKNDDCYIWVAVDDSVRVPSACVHDGWVILDISSSGVDAFSVGDGWMSFVADFPDNPDFTVCLPVCRILRVGSPNEFEDGVRFEGAGVATDELWERCPVPELYDRPKVDSEPADLGTSVGFRVIE